MEYPNIVSERKTIQCQTRNAKNEDKHTWSIRGMRERSWNNNIR